MPPPDIRQLHELMRYRFKLTNIMTGEKIRVLNCLTVSDLKPDDVLSDVFGKSSRSIIHYILEHPGEIFNVVPLIDRSTITLLRRFRPLLMMVLSPTNVL